MLLGRGIDVSYKEIRKWVNLFSPAIINNLKKIRLKKSRKTWFVDEVFLKIKGVKHIVVKPSMNYTGQSNRWIRQRSSTTAGFKDFVYCENLCFIFEELKNFFWPQKYKK
jgi:transposase-like protein